jgi:pimeloyl-ACP methyl ester carboxylesterase
MRRWLVWLAVGLLTSPALAISPEPALSFAALEAAHAEPGSRFIDVAGVRLHYVDEGQGPALVLLNASYLNLSSWRAVADRLKGKHRVIRLDFPTVGLSRASRPEALDIKAFEGQVLGLMDRLRVDKATLAGTSSGAIVAFRLAADHPERFDRLVLLNAAGLPRTAATDPLRERPRAPGAPAPGSLAFWRQSLSDNFADASRLEESFVGQVHDWSRREGVQADARAFMKGFVTGDPQAVLGKIKMPSLILWGEKGITLSHLEAEVFAQWLAQAPALIRKYADAGHYPQVEQPDGVATDIAAFMAGKLDPQLRPPPGPAAQRLEDVPFWQANAGLWLGEDVYLTAAGERKTDGYANLTETRVAGEVMEDEEYRFFGPSDMASAMAAGKLRAGEGVEVRRLLKGRMADAGGRVVLLPGFSGQPADMAVTVQPFASGVGMMTVQPMAGGPQSYRVHIDVTAPDQRLRTTMGLADGSPGAGSPGSLRAIAIYRETRQAGGDRDMLLKALRARFKVAVVIETSADGKQVVRRLAD